MATIEIDDKLAARAAKLLAKTDETVQSRFGPMMNTYLKDLIKSRLRDAKLFDDPTIRWENGVPVFSLPPGSPKCTIEDVKRAQAELDLMDYKKALCIED
jgi:hypothetical protein